MLRRRCHKCRRELSLSLLCCVFSWLSDKRRSLQLSQLVRWPAESARKSRVTLPSIKMTPRNMLKKIIMHAKTAAKIFRCDITKSECFSLKEVQNNQVNVDRHADENHETARTLCMKSIPQLWNDFIENHREYWKRTRSAYENPRRMMKTKPKSAVFFFVSKKLLLLHSV